MSRFDELNTKVDKLIDLLAKYHRTSVDLIWAEVEANRSDAIYVAKQSDLFFVDIKLKGNKDYVLEYLTETSEAVKKDVSFAKVPDDDKKKEDS